MTTNQYIIDTSSLIELNKHNPIDVFPTVWDKLRSFSKGGYLIAPTEVFSEVKEGDDELVSWSKQNMNLFQPPTEKQIEILKDILKKYPASVKERRKYDADAWVIALALERKVSNQKEISERNRIVVTEERLDGEKIKIPLVCNKYGIDSINIIKMFRIEGWKF